MKLKILLVIAIVLFVLILKSFAVEQYPKIDVSGFKKWEYKTVNVDPQLNYFLGITHLGGFSPTSTGGPWQERLQLRILGQLTEKLSVSYDVEQQPEAPDRYDVRVKYDNKHELVFGDFSAGFSGNEFASATKYLNGVMVTSKDQNYELIAVPSSKLKSQVQNLTSQKGNNTKGPYSLGHGSILENSERIELNGVLITRGKDYTIDYYEGKITFNKILTSNDEFKYSYEYTNILDLFFPSLSKKDFFGLQGKFTIDPSTIGKKMPVPTPVLLTTRETFPTIAKTNPAIKISSTLEAFGTNEAIANSLTLEANEDLSADESVGKYKLQKTPILPFSEVLTLNGSVLRKDEDYIIKYNDGKITLLLPNLPNNKNKLEITYKYYKTSKNVDNILGYASRGPYTLSNPYIVSESEKIYIDEKLVIRGFDYTIDNEKGKITFNYNVPSTSNIKVSYTSQIRELPQSPSPSKHPTSLTLGVTYLKEFAQKSTSSISSSYTDTRTGQNILDNNSTVYLTKFPVLTSAEGGTVSVTINGNPATAEIDYAIPSVEVDSNTGYAIVKPQAKLAYINDLSDISDGYYTGTIKFLTSIEATSEVIISYQYYKTITGRYTGSGNGSRGPYYVKNYRNIVPGSEKVEVWVNGSSVTDVYVRNSSFEANGGDKGYFINYTKDSPYVTFNKELSPSQSFSVYFQYVSPQSNTSSNISQDLAGFDGTFKYGDIIEVEGAFARSSNDQVITVVATSETFSNFSQNTNRIVLSSKPVSENTERLYVNNYLMNRDADYFIDYSSGIVTFYYITLSTSDSIRVDYEYQSQQGVDIGTKSKIDTAYKYGIKSKLGKVSVAYNAKNVGFDFSPLGGTAIGVGSNYKDFSIATDPMLHNFTAGYSYREINNPISNSRTFFNKNYDRNYNFSLNPFSLASIGFGYRNQEVRGDPEAINGANTADSSLHSYSLTLTPVEFKKGIVVFTQKYDASRTLSSDRIGFTRGKTNAGHLGYGLSLGDRIKMSSDFQLSEPMTWQNQTGETITAWNLSRDFGYDMSLDLTFSNIQKLTTYAKQFRHEALSIISYSKLETKNTTYHIDFNPVAILNSSYDYNRQETPSVVVDGKNPTNEKASTSLKLSPYAFLSTGWAYAQDFTISETARESQGKSNTYTATLNPISLEKVKLISNYTLFDRDARTPSGTLEVQTATKTFSQDYSLALAPSAILSVTPGFIQEDYFNSTSTSSTELKASNQTIRCKVNFKPTEKLNLDADYTLKVTTSLIDKISRHKALFSLKTAYKILSWGELAYNLEDEHNEGEIQAGGTIPDIDYLKTTNGISFSFNVPQDSPILNSILLTASYKVVKFENRKRTSDNLFASLVTFEGALNF